MEGSLGWTPKLCPFPSLLPSLGPHPSTSCSCCTHRAGGPLGAQCFLLHGSRDHVPLSKGPYKGQAVEMASSAPSAWGCLPSGATSDFVQRLKRPLRACEGTSKNSLEKHAFWHKIRDITPSSALRPCWNLRGRPTGAPSFRLYGPMCSFTVTNNALTCLVFCSYGCYSSRRPAAWAPWPFPVLVTIDSVETGPAVGLWTRSLACLFHSLPRRP